MTKKAIQSPEDPSSARGRTPADPARERPGGPTQDDLLDEALKETFPASDSISVYQFR